MSLLITGLSLFRIWIFGSSLCPLMELYLLTVGVILPRSFLLCCPLPFLWDDMEKKYNYWVYFLFLGQRCLLICSVGEGFASEPLLFRFNPCFPLTAPALGDLSCWHFHAVLVSAPWVSIHIWLLDFQILICLSSLGDGLSWKITTF